MKIKNIITVWLVAFILISCAPAVKAVPTETITVTSTFAYLPPATATVTPIPIPTLASIQGAPQPDTTLVESVIRSFVNAMNESGIRLESIKIASELKYQKVAASNGEPFIIASTFVDAITEIQGEPLEGFYPLLIARYSSKTENWYWEEATLKNLGDITLPMGGTLDFSDKNWDSTEYTKTVLQQFSIISSSGGFTEKWWHYNGADYWTDYAIKNQIPFVVRPFWSGTSDDYPSELKTADKSSIMQYIQNRTRKILRYVRKLRDNDIPVQIELNNEPTFYYQNKMYWMGMFPDNHYWLFLYDAFKDQWMTETYIQLYQISTSEFELTPGKDFTVIGIIEPGIELPGSQTDYIINLVIDTKQEIADRLGTTPKEIPFDIGVEFHLGKTELTHSRNVTVPLDKIDPEVIASNLQNISKETNSRIFITEMDALVDEKHEEGQAYAKVIQAAINSGVVENILFFRPLSYAPVDDPWQSHLFEPNYQKGIVYYLTLKGVLDAVSLR